MTIDINNVNIQKLKLEDLIADATARNDKEAEQWLTEQAMKKIEVTDKNGNTKMKYQPVNSFRVEYLEKFCGYKKKEAVKLSADDKRRKKLAEMFAQAKAKIQ